MYKELILKLKKEWFEDIKPFIEFDKPNPSLGIGDTWKYFKPWTPTEMDYQFPSQMLYEYLEKQKFANILNSLRLQFVQKISAEVKRCVLIICCELGHQGDDFGMCDFFRISGGLNKVKRLKEFDAFSSLVRIDNFLKHHTLRAYKELKEDYPDFLYPDKEEYENGMYAGDWLKLENDYIDALFSKLITFLDAWCKHIKKLVEMAVSKPRP